MEVDILYLSSFCALPEPSLNTLLTNPTAELVKTLLINLTSKAREYESVKSENVKLAVELENAVRAGESKSRLLKGSVDKSLKEAAELRNRLQQEANARTALEAELQSLRSSSSSSSEEVASLKSRVVSLESTNQDTLSLLESKSKAYDELASELSAKHQKTLELRQQISEHEQTIRSISSSVSTSKYREQSLQRDIDSLKRNNEWLDQELKTKSTEYSQLRKEKSAQIAELKRQNDDAAVLLEASIRTEKTLRIRLDELSSKADEYLVQIQQLREDAMRQEENFQSELDTANRLTELMKNSMNTEKFRQQELQEQLEKARDIASAEIGRINAEVETEHQERVNAEQRVTELEVQVEQLEAELHTSSRRTAMPGTPRPTVNGTGRDSPMREGAASRMSPGSSHSRGGLSYTQLFSEYHSTKAELESEKRRNQKLDATINEMMQDLETHKPEVEELKADHDRLEADVLEMSTIIDIVSKERDQAKKQARRWEGQVAGLTREGDLLRQQLRDLSSQVKVLLMELNRHHEGLDTFTPEERARLFDLARGKIPEEYSQEATATDQYISRNLTTFRNIAELQEQNTRLLRVARELGEKMEGEEAQRKTFEATRNLEELESLRQECARCRDEIKSLITQSQSYIRERDMFRRMLAHRGQLPPGTDLASVFGESNYGGESPATPSRNHTLNTADGTSSSKEIAQYTKLIKDLESHFDSYRQEAAAERSTLKEQVDNLSKKNGELRAEVSKKSGEVTLTHERYEMLQANYTMLKNENGELQKRSQSLSERSAQQEMKIQQVAEDLVESKGLLESLRNETANLKAEKQFWKTVEKRLTEDNQSLTNERDRLNTLNTSLQNLLNERDYSDNTSRRRLEVQVETMESELQTLRRKLSDEVEESKRVASSRAFEQQQYQTKINDLMASIGSYREESAALKATRDQLQARVDEMTIELKSAEERVQVLLSAPTSSVTRQVGGADTNAGASAEPSMSKEQELALEVSELKRDLELTKAEIESSKVQIQQYKAISQSSEEELQSLNETNDQFRQEMDEIIAERDTKIQELKVDLENVNSELMKWKSELSTAEAAKLESDRRLEEQKAQFEAEISKLKEISEQHEVTARYCKQDLKTQADIATQAQQGYESELVKHGETTKNLQTLRAQYNQIKLEVVELKTEVESARANLAQNEENWAEARERYERELAELKARRDDTNAQNKLLYAQLENVNKQISALQQKRTLTDQPEDDTNETSSTGLKNLQELVKYLRDEKEIVDVQLELSTQEAKRLKQQLDYTQTQFEETRLKLNQMRRAEENSERDNLSHNKLMETINELNLNRESNVTLRLEKNQAQASLAEKSKLVDELREQIQSLQARLTELEDEKEAREEDLRMTREARERFEQRYHDLLSKSNVVDPAEYDTLKEQVKTLEAQLEEAASANQALQAQVDAHALEKQQLMESHKVQLQEQRARLSEQAKAKAREQSAQIKEKDAALQTTLREKDAVQQQLVQTQQDLTAAVLSRDQAIANRATSEAAMSQHQVGSEDGQVNDVRPSQTELLELQIQAEAAMTKASEEAARSMQLQEEVNAEKTKVSRLQNQLEDAQQNLEKIKAQTSRAQIQQVESQQLVKAQKQSSDGPNSPHHQENSTSESQAISSTELVDVVNSILSDEQIGSLTLSEQLVRANEGVRLELNARYEARKRELEEQYVSRADRMKAQLNKRLVEEKEHGRVAEEKHAKAVQSLKAQYDAELQNLKARHEEELDELKGNEENRFQQFKQQWSVEHPATITNGAAGTVTGPKGEPAPVSTLELSEAQVQDLVANNETVKAIVRRNITSNLKKEREALLAQAKEGTEKAVAAAVADTEAKAAVAKEQAVALEVKRNSVKISMGENRARAAQAKIDFVEKAAQETPQRPVGEVWSLAKVVKPATVAAKPPQPVVDQVAASSKPAPETSIPTTSTPGQGVAFGKPSGVQQATPTTAVNPIPTNANTPNEQPIPHFTAPPSAVANPFKNTNVPNEQPSSQQDQTQTRLPDKPLQSQGIPRPNAGTGPAPFKGMQSGLPVPSGIPVPSGGRAGQSAPNPFLAASNPQNQQQQSRGGGLNNRGRGRGRGGIPTIATNQQPIQQQGQSGSPNPTPTPGFNPAAKQFVPNANKRPREDGQDGGAHAGNGNGKRIRGGGPQGGNV